MVSHIIWLFDYNECPSMVNVTHITGIRKERSEHFTIYHVYTVDGRDTIQLFQY